MSPKSVTFATVLTVLCGGLGGTVFAPPSRAAEHQEFDAVLRSPFHADNKGLRTITLHFSYPDSEQTQQMRWLLELINAKDRGLQRWQGTLALGAAPLEVPIRWQSRPGTSGLPPGIYRLRLRAGIGDSFDIEQTWDVAVGLPRPPAAASASASASPPTLASAAMPEPATRYTVHLGNLHSQTNHSDGGGALDHCTGSQAPQSAALGPTDAYAYAQRQGLDFLMTSEHNHMFDGSDGTNADADPAAVKALYRSGVQAAAAWNLAHPDFLGIYGQEWGVINNGGHLNILNSDDLLGWERNTAGDLLADTATPKNDYAALYALMRARGWVGQFNHPREGQFAIDGKALAWTPDGDQAMLLCEVMNSNAFSIRTDESEPQLSNFEAGCNKLLEAGYHVAFSSDQDNHCANWGASYGNRTGVLLKRREPLTRTTLLAALQARRVYATMDKNAELIFMANGHMMGERFDNKGKLSLQVLYAHQNRQRPAVINVVQGVPGRNGTVTVLSHKAKTTFTPAAGEHFYYAKVTQHDGRVLWSAPIWVTQR
jgi:hypothetical protein